MVHSGCPSLKSTSSCNSSKGECMDFTNRFLKLYKEGLKIVPSNIYTATPVSDMSRTKPVYWNISQNVGILQRIPPNI